MDRFWWERELEILKEQRENKMQKPMCQKCNGTGEITSYVNPPGWKASHNRRVRSYGGGRRPKSSDFKVLKTVKCVCQFGGEAR